MADPRVRLEALLAVSPNEAEASIRQTWRRLAGSDAPPIVLFGAGRLGAKLAKGLEGTPFRVLAFTDNASHLWGTTLEGLPVWSPAEAIRNAPSHACFVVSIWRASGGHPYKDTCCQLEEAGALHVAHAGHLMRLLPERFLPHFALDLPQRIPNSAELIRAAFDTLEDPESREVFLGHLAWRKDLNFDALGAPWEEDIYFPATWVNPQQGDVLVDAGAYDGDTFRSALARWGKRLGCYHAFEPDPMNRRALEVCTQASGAGERVRIHGHALGATAGWGRFRSGEALSSVLAEDGDQVVWCDTLDRVVGADRIAHLKLDIEGAEPEALRGARGLLQRDRPFLAISAYHFQEHLWELPLLVRELRPDYRLHYRDNGTEGWDLVLYAR